MIHDERYPLCDECHYFSREIWKGEDWESCRRWGFRLTERPDEHDPERCESFATEEQWRSRERMMETATKKRKRR